MYILLHIIYIVGARGARRATDRALLFMRMTCCDNPAGYSPADSGHTRKIKLLKRRPEKQY